MRLKLAISCFLNHPKFQERARSCKQKFSLPSLQLHCHHQVNPWLMHLLPLQVRSLIIFELDRKGFPRASVEQWDPHHHRSQQWIPKAAGVTQLCRHNGGIGEKTSPQYSGGLSKDGIVPEPSAAIHHKEQLKLPSLVRIFCSQIKSRICFSSVLFLVQFRSG